MALPSIDSVWQIVFQSLQPWKIETQHATIAAKRNLFFECRRIFSTLRVISLAWLTVVLGISLKFFYFKQSLSSFLIHSKLSTAYCRHFRIHFSVANFITTFASNSFEILYCKVQTVRTNARATLNIVSIFILNSFEFHSSIIIYRHSYLNHPYYHSKLILIVIQKFTFLQVPVRNIVITLSSIQHLIHLNFIENFHFEHHCFRLDHQPSNILPLISSETLL